MPRESIAPVATHRRVKWILVPSLLLIAIASGCGRQPLNLNVSQDVARPPAYVVIFFADGLSVRRMDELLASGHLPNIDRRFVQGGVRVEKAVSCLPALTYPNSVSLMTGVFPGRHGIMGNQLFDRRNMYWVDYITAESYQRVNQDFSVPTLYELIPDHFTMNVQCPTQRGVTFSLDNPAETGIAWFLGWHIEVDQFVGSCIEQVGPAADRAGRWPSVLTFYFPGLDETGHQQGPDSAGYRNAVINIDIQIGRVTDAMERAGMLDNAHLVLVSDHGHVATQRLRRFDLIDWLRKDRGLRCHIGDIPRIGYPERTAFLNRYDLMIVDGSRRRLLIHVRGERGWAQPASDEEISRVVTGLSARGQGIPLHELPCVEYVATRAGEDRVRVFSRTGQAIVERRMAGSVRAYRVTSDGVDPLGLAETPQLQQFIAPGWRPSREWLAQTAGTQHPDFVPQIVEYFDAPTAGDMVVFSASDWVFGGADPGEHGSCHPEDMRIPLFFAGPGLPRGTSIPHGRIVDVMPTVLDLLGESDRLRTAPPIDGESLLPQLRTAESGPTGGGDEVELRGPTPTIRHGKASGHE